MFQDEARFGRLDDPRRCWAPAPSRPVVKTAVVREFTYAYAALCPEDGALVTLVLPYANTEGMNLFLAEVAKRFPEDFIVMVLDGAGWHRSKGLKIPENIRFVQLPSYSPELNPVEQFWAEMREKYFHNRCFTSLEAVEQHLAESLALMEADAPRIRRLSAWPWIKNPYSLRAA